MDTHFEDMSTRLFSPKLWRGFGAPTNMNPSGSSYQAPSGNPAFGFFDDFLTFQASSLEGPYLILETDGIAVEQVNCTAGAKGIVAITMDAGTQNDEGILQWGRGLGAPFKLADKDLAFECRFAVSAIATGKQTLALGLSVAGAGATNGLIADGGAALTDTNFLGFVSLDPEGPDWDGAYKADGQTYQDGDTKTKLDALATFTASVTTYKKLGFRYRANPKTVEWYVNGAMPGGKITPARLTASECNADTFPDDVFLTPIIGNLAGDASPAAHVTNIDWWACAQYE